MRVDLLPEWVSHLDLSRDHNDNVWTHALRTDVTTPDCVPNVRKPKVWTEVTRWVRALRGSWSPSQVVYRDTVDSVRDRPPSRSTSVDGGWRERTRKGSRGDWGKSQTEQLRNLKSFTSEIRRKSKSYLSKLSMTNVSFYIWDGRFGISTEPVDLDFFSR